MPIGTAAAITASTRALSPLITDLYKAAKGGASKGLRRWQEASFPKRLAKKIDDLAKVKTLWSSDDEVSLLEFYYPPRFGGGERLAQKAVESLKDLGDGNIVIQGIVGQGKSIFLRYLAIKEATRPESNRLPIFIELRTLQDSNSLRSAIFATLSTYDIDIDEETFDHLARSGRIVLLLDAFDELDEGLVRGTLNELEKLARKYSELQIVVTSRPSNEIQKVSGFRVIRILPLSRNDYGPMLTRLGLPSTKIFDIIEAIKNSPSKLADLITTPLMLTLVVIVYESEKEIPPTLPEFFERLFQVVFTRHDRMKAGFNRKRHSGLSERQLQTLFEAFCFMAIQNSFGRSLSSEQFSIAFGQAQEYSGNAKCEEDKFRLDIVKVACLMLEEGIDTSTFLHKSLLEYYAAAFIKHSTDDVAKLFYQAAAENYRPWQDVLRFLADIDPYRYSKEFALEQISNIRHEFIAPLKDRKDLTLIRVIRSIHPSMAVGYRHSHDDEFSMDSFGPFGMRPRPMYSVLDDLLITAFEETLPNDASQSELEAILDKRIEPENVDDEIEVPLQLAIKYGGSGHFWNAIERFSEKVDQMELEAKEIIAEQEKRKLIFKKIPDKNS